MKRKLFIAIPLLLAVAVAAWFFRPKHEVLGEGYIGERSVTLWSGVAQVREPLDALHYGDRVEIVARHNGQCKSANHQRRNWMDRCALADETALWQRSAKLLGEAQELPVQARGRTKVATNFARSAGPHTTSPLSIRPRHPSGNCRPGCCGLYLRFPDEKESVGDAGDSRKEDSRKKTPKKKNGFSFEVWPLARPVRLIHARRILPPPLNLVTGPRPLPADHRTFRGNGFGRTL